MAMSDDLRTAIDLLAASQHGHVARWQLLALGLSEDAADKLPARLGWTALSRGVSLLPGHRTSTAGSTWAALLATMSLLMVDLTRPAGPLDPEVIRDVARRTIGATGFTGATLRGLVPNAPTRSQVLIPHHLVKRLADVRTIRTRVYPEHLELVDDVPTVPAVRMLWDCGWVLRHERDAPARLRRLMSLADGVRLVEAETLHLAALHPREHGLPGQVPVPFRIAALSLKDGHSHSGTEHDARELVDEVAARYGLHVEPRPTDIAADGVAAGEADIAIPLLRLDIEIDGPHHREPGQRAKDRRRDARFRQIDWIVRRYDAEFVSEDPVGFQRCVEQDILQAAAAQGITLRKQPHA
ncbi:hypothetical protein [Euzebya sp.]|uniref:hypothetical protein n=1 Tax=Euzebya sp. TaxID=1971409 RepID=UPI003514119F